MNETLKNTNITYSFFIGFALLRLKKIGIEMQLTGKELLLYKIDLLHISRFINQVVSIL